MNRYQKIAWLNITLITSTILLTSAIIAVELHLVGYSQYFLFGVAPMIPLKFTPLMFKKPESKNGVVCDERDGLIVTQAMAFATKAYWWVFFVLSFVLHFLIGPKNSVPVIALPFMMILGALFIKVACSISILVQYGKGIKNGEG